MRPTGTEIEQLRYARERGEQLRADWRAANGPNARPWPNVGGLVETTRIGAGRTLIGLGTFLLPRREPCA